MPEMVAMWVESWEDPAMRHAILVHFPIVIAVMLIPLSFGAMVWRGSGRTALTVLSLIGCLLLIGTAYVAKESGSEAHHALGTIIDTQDSKAIGQHAQDAVRIWWLGCVAAGLLLLLAPNIPLRLFFRLHRPGRLCCTRRRSRRPPGLQTRGGSAPSCGRAVDSCRQS